jgi:hypothetical protein
MSPSVPAPAALTTVTHTQVPDPSTIRPLPVLQRTLELLKTKWREENNYGYICDQFKSMRQDLTVSPRSLRACCRS